MTGGLGISAVLLLALQGSSLGPVDGQDLPGVDPERVQVGDLAPDFRLYDHLESVYQLSQYRGRNHVVLVFYRGRW